MYEDISSDDEEEEESVTMHTSSIPLQVSFHAQNYIHSDIIINIHLKLKITN